MSTQKYTEIKKYDATQHTEFSETPNSQDAMNKSTDIGTDSVVIQTDPPIPIGCSFQRLKGMLMVGASGLLLLSTTSLAKYLKHIPIGEYLFIRFIFSLCFILPTLTFQEKTIDPKGKFLLILSRCILGSINALCKFWAVIKLEYGNAIALAACAPVFAAIFSRILWKEKINVLTVISLIIGICGMTLIAKPSFIFGSNEGETKEIGVFALVPIFGSMCLGLGYSLLRKVGDKPHILIVPLVQALCLIPISAIFQVAKQDSIVFPGCQTERFLLVLSGLVTMVALFLMNRGLAIEKSGPGSLVRNVDLVFAFVIQVVLFDEPLDMLSGLGALLIICSTLTVAANKAFGERCKVYEF